MRWHWEWFSNMAFWRSKPELIRHERKLCICGRKIAVTKEQKFYRHKCELTIPARAHEVSDLYAEADQQDGRR